MSSVSVQTVSSAFSQQLSKNKNDSGLLLREKTKPISFYVQTENENNSSNILCERRKKNSIDNNNNNTQMK